MLDNTIIQVNTYLNQYISMENILNDTSGIDPDVFNTLNVNLTILSNTLDSSSCLYNIITTYKKILVAITNAFNVKNALGILTANTEQYKNDSIILHDSNLLQEYIRELSNKITLFSVHVQSSLAVIKPNYAMYNDMYGIPLNLQYDPILLLEIEKSLL